MVRAFACTGICFLMFICWLGGWTLFGVLPLAVLLILILLGELFPNLLQ